VQRRRRKYPDVIDDPAERIDEFGLANLSDEGVPLDTMLVNESSGERFDFVGRNGRLPILERRVDRLTEAPAEAECCWTLKCCAAWPARTL
jgi:hypothetical protein